MSSEMQHVHRTQPKNGHKTKDIVRRRKENLNENVDQQKPKTYAFILREEKCYRTVQYCQEVKKITSRTKISCLNCTPKTCMNLNVLLGKVILLNKQKGASCAFILMQLNLPTQCYTNTLYLH